VSQIWQGIRFWNNTGFLISRSCIHWWDSITPSVSFSFSFFHLCSYPQDLTIFSQTKLNLSREQWSEMEAMGGLQSQHSVWCDTFEHSLYLICLLYEPKKPPFQIWFLYILLVIIVPYLRQTKTLTTSWLRHLRSISCSADILSVSENNTNSLQMLAPARFN